MSDGCPVCNGIGRPPSLSAIRRLRKGLGMSLGDLADRCGIARGYLSMIETDQANPTLSTLAEIAHALEVPVIALLVGGRK